MSKCKWGFQLIKMPSSGHAGCRLWDGRLTPLSHFVFFPSLSLFRWYWWLEDHSLWGNSWVLWKNESTNLENKKQCGDFFQKSCESFHCSTYFGKQLDLGWLIVTDYSADDIRTKNVMRKLKVLSFSQFRRWKPPSEEEWRIKDMIVARVHKCLGAFCLGFFIKNTIAFSCLHPLLCMIAFTSWVSGLVQMDYLVVNCRSPSSPWTPKALCTSALFLSVPAWFMFTTWLLSLASLVTYLYLLMPVLVQCSERR